MKKLALTLLTIAALVYLFPLILAAILALLV